MKKGFIGLLIFSLIGLMVGGLLFKKSTVIIVSPGVAVLNTRADFGWIVEMVRFSLQKGDHSFAPEEAGFNINTIGFGEALLDTSEIRLGHDWNPITLSLDDQGVWIDAHNEPIHVVFFEMRGRSSNEATALLARRYRVAAWAVGKNGINEFGGGDDIFLGLRWNGERESEHYVSPWWKFWER